MNSAASGRTSRRVSHRHSINSASSPYSWRWRGTRSVLPVWPSTSQAALGPCGCSSKVAASEIRAR